MPRDDRVYVGHMLDQARKGIAMAQGLDRAKFDSDEILRFALTHVIQTIGESARRVSDEFRAEHGEVPWKKIVGMRHKVVHDYLHVDYDLVWDVAMTELPRLAVQLERILSPAS